MTRREYVEELRQQALDYQEAIAGRKIVNLGLDRECIRRWDAARLAMSAETFIAMADAWLAADHTAEINRELRESQQAGRCA